MEVNHGKIGKQLFLCESKDNAFSLPTTKMGKKSDAFAFFLFL